MTQNTPPVFEHVALIGLGLIGASLALAIRKNALARRVSGYSRSEKTRDRARALGLCDEVAESAQEAVAGADLVILCVPPGAMDQAAREIAADVMPGTVVSDVGSVKGGVSRSLSAIFDPGVHVIPAHPVAGTEESGPDAGIAELFNERWCILTPPADADADALGRVETFWRGCGARVDTMDAKHHDDILAITSHMPHLVAYALATIATDAHDKGGIDMPIEGKTGDRGNPTTIIKYKINRDPESGKCVSYTMFLHGREKIELGKTVKLSTTDNNTGNVFKFNASYQNLKGFTVSCKTMIELKYILQRKLADNGDVIRFAAGGFRDFTRIAASDPVMWHDVFLANRDAVLKALEMFTVNLGALRAAVRRGDSAALLEFFSRTRRVRHRIVDAGQDSRRADFGRPHPPVPPVPPES